MSDDDYDLARQFEWAAFIMDHPEFRFENPNGDDRENRVWPVMCEWRRQRMERAATFGFEEQIREFQERARQEVQGVVAQLTVFDTELREREIQLNKQSESSRADLEKERAQIEAQRGLLRAQLDQFNDAKTALGGIDPAVLQQLLPRGADETLAAYRLRTGKTGKDEDAK
jgi:hypothetical protein